MLYHCFYFTVGDFIQFFPEIEATVSTQWYLNHALLVQMCILSEIFIKLTIDLYTVVWSNAENLLSCIQFLPGVTSCKATTISQPERH